MGSLEDTLKLIRSSASLEYTLSSDLSLLLRVEIAFTRNSSLCLAFLRRCADYQGFMAALCSPPITWPTSSRVGTSHSLCERAMRPPFETTGNPAENADGVEGLSLWVTCFDDSHRKLWNYCLPGFRKFRAAYKQTLSLEQKTIIGLNNLLGNLASWVVATDTLHDEFPPAILTLQQLRDLSHAWAVARDSVRGALASLTSEPARRLYYRSASLAGPRPRSVTKRWMMNLVCLS